MKRITQLHSGKWSDVIFADTDDPMPPHDGAPAPEEPFGSPQPPVYTEIGRPVFN